MQDSAVAGACAGLASSVLTCPLDVVKTQLQAQGAFSPSLSGTGSRESAKRPDHPIPPASSASSTRSVARQATSAKPSYPSRSIRTIVPQIWAGDGIRGFYHGLGPTVLGYLPTWAIYFTLYDQAKLRLINVDLGFNVQLSGHIMSAMLAGAATTTISSPLWVVKTRFMVQALPRPGEVPYRNTLDAFVRIYKGEGITAFYKGLVPSLMGTSHVAVQFPLYDNLKTLVTQYNHRSETDPLSPQEILACSTTSKMVASFLTYPHEVLRTQLQMQYNRPTRPQKLRSSPSAGPTPHALPPQTRLGMIALMKSIWRESGIAGFYKGMAINLLRTLPNSAMTLLTYELIMQHLQSSHRSKAG